MTQNISKSGHLSPTGIQGLDSILLGGLVEKNVVIVEGMPGTGKTNLSLGYLYNGAVTHSDPGIFISFETPPEKIRRDSLTLGWDFEALEARNLIGLAFTSPVTMIEELATGSKTLTNLVRGVQAKRLVIDGLTPLKLASDRLGARPYRESLVLLFDVLRNLGLTPLLTTETSVTNPIGETSSREEHYLADTILTLRNQARRRSVHRSIEIAKSRGQEFVNGRHALRMATGNGLEIYPRVYARSADDNPQPTSDERVSTGNESLNEMLGGGILKGSITLVAGVSGTGKTVAGMQFLTEGANQGETCLMVSLDEHAEQIRRNARSLGLAFNDNVDRKKIFILYDSPLEIDLDEHFYAIKAAVEKHQITRVVMDSVATYESAQPDEAREFLVALSAYFKSKLIPVFFNFECPELLGISQISDQLKSSAMVDNIVLLSFVEISTMIRRAISIPKARGSHPAQRTKEYLIQQGGLAILEDTEDENSDKVPQLALSSYYSVLGRAPTRHSPIIDEHVASGKPLPKSKIPKPVPRVKRSKAKRKT